MSKLIDIAENTNQRDGKNSLAGVAAIKINLRDFEQCYTYRDHQFAAGNSRLVSEIMERWDERLKGTATVTINEIYIDPAKIMRIDTQAKRIYPVSPVDVAQLELGEIAVSRAIAKVSAEGLGHQNAAPAIAINFSEKGFEIGWGHRVYVCQNFNILNTEHRWNDYEKFRGAGQNKVSFDLKQLKGILTPFMDETEAHFSQAIALVERMRNCKIGRSAFQAFMGQLFTKIEYANAMRVERKIALLSAEEKSLPVTSRQLAAIAVESVQPHHPQIFGWSGDETNVYNLVNWASEAIKAEKGTDMLTILRNNAQWTEAVINAFPN